MGRAAGCVSRCRRSGVGLSAAIALCAGAAFAVPAAHGAESGMLELEGSLTERPSPFAWLTGDTSPTLRSVIDAIDEAADDRSMDGLVVRLKDAALNTAQIEELGQAMDNFRATGKKIHIFAEFYMGQEILISSFADEAIMQSGGATLFTGLHMEEMYLADMFAWAGIEPDYIQVGDYKGASEAYMNAEPSPAWDAHLDSFLDSMYETMRGHIMSGKDMSGAELDDAMRKAFLGSGASAIESGLIDATVDLPLLEAHLADQYGSEIDWVEVEPEGAESQIDTSNPFAMFSILSSTPDYTPTRPTIAVLHIDGVIMDGDSQPAGFLGQGGSVGSRTIRNTIETIRDEDLIKGVVVRVNSPGGSAIASEVMWQGLQRLSETKPVWVSVGSMAASGGYYIAVGGDKIYANPSSIVGSIGVVGGKLATGGLMDKVHVNVVERSRGPIAGIMSATAPWNETERQVVREAMVETYEQFVGRVTTARPNVDPSTSAEGRIFVGSDALELNMIDEIGTLADAVGDLAEAQGLSRYDIMDYPGPKGFEEFIEESFGGIIQSPAASIELPLAAMIEKAVGPHAWPAVRDGINAMALMRDRHVLLTSPRVLIFR